MRGIRARHVKAARGGAAPARSVRSEDAARHASQPDQGRRAYRLRRAGSTGAWTTIFVGLGTPSVRHCGSLIPASFTTLVQCATCASTNVPNSAGVPPAGSAPTLPNASRTDDFANALLIAALSLATVSLGVPLLAEKPTQSSTTSDGNPASTIVGTSPSTARRLGPVTASARNLPVLIRSTTGNVVMNMNWLVSLRRSVIACGNC